MSGPLKKKPKGYESAKIYYTHDNGDRPFLVYISPFPEKKVAVFTYGVHEDDDFYDDQKKSSNWRFYPKLIAEFRNILRVFVGDDPECEVPRDDWCKGNSILIQVSPRKYVFVGDSVYSFCSREPITSYHSPVGNNDVPYPVAESKRRYFFMGDHKWMWKDKLVITSKDPDRMNDLYFHFYGHGGVKQDPKNQGPFENVKVLQKRRW